MARADGWGPPTLASVEGRDPRELVRCCCGRLVQAQQMYDYGPVPAAERPRHPGGPRYVCDGCREIDFCTGRLPKARYLEHLAAPADLLAKVRADRFRPQVRNPAVPLDVAAAPAVVPVAIDQAGP